jgi:hypothetical protein
MVPIAVDALMSCDCADESDRTDNVDEPLGLGAMELEEPGDGGARSIAILDAAGPEAQGTGEGKAGRGEFLLDTRGVSGTRLGESVTASVS